MNTLDLNALEKFIRRAQKLQVIADELKPFLELINTLDGKDLTMPTDRLIRSHEAAQILGVNVATIKRIERRGIRPTLSTVLKLADALKVKPGLLLGDVT